MGNRVWPVLFRMPSKPSAYRPPGWKPYIKPVQSCDSYYNSSEWKMLRAIVLKRDGYRCTAIDCDDPTRGRGRRLIVDHIIERRKGGADHEGNLRTLCPTCDNRRHAAKGRG